MRCRRECRIIWSLVFLLPLTLALGGLMAGPDAQAAEVRGSKNINTEGTSLILVEQDVLTALELTSRAYVLEAGRITLSGQLNRLWMDRLHD